MEAQYIIVLAAQGRTVLTTPFLRSRSLSSTFSLSCRSPCLLATFFIQS